MSTRTKAIGYVRVATTKQTLEDCDNIVAQKQMITKAADDMEIDIVQWFEELGAKSMDEPYPVLNKALEYCKHNTDITYLVVSDISRISRFLAQSIYWTMCFERIGVTIKNIANPDELSPLDSFIERLTAVASQLEHQIRSDAVKRGLRLKKEREE